MPLLSEVFFLPKKNSLKFQIHQLRNLKINQQNLINTNLNPVHHPNWTNLQNFNPSKNPAPNEMKFDFEFDVFIKFLFQIPNVKWNYLYLFSSSLNFFYTSLFRCMNGIYVTTLITYCDPWFTHKVLPFPHFSWFRVSIKIWLSAKRHWLHKEIAFLLDLWLLYDSVVCICKHFYL